MSLLQGWYNEQTMQNLVSEYRRGNFQNIFWALVIANGLSFFLLLIRAASAGNFRYGFLGWNLLIGWLPLLFAWWLSLNLAQQRWSKPSNLALTVAWLAFLPNSFYLISDLVHLHFTGEVSLVYDVAMFFLFIFNALVIGYISIFIVHGELIKRLGSKYAHSLIAAIFLLVGFAIYLGRYLRWNTWDILVSPAGLLFDLSERVVNPSSHPQAFSTTAVFFILLSTMYLVMWNLVCALTQPSKRKR